jgi:hypothetical protein
MGPVSSTSAVVPVKSALSSGEDTTVTVPGGANVFGAGIEEPAPGGGGGGVPPTCVAVPAGVSTVTVPRTGGSLSFTPLRAPELHFHKCPGGGEAVLAHGPDGDAGVCPGDVPGGTILAAGGVSGIASKDRGGYLIGVFLPARWSGGTPPATLDFALRPDPFSSSRARTAVRSAA